jgi:acyl carrier protein
LKRVPTTFRRIAEIAMGGVVFGGARARIQRNRCGMPSLSKLHQVISEVLRMPPERITSELSIHKVDTWNSLTHIELVVTVEESFHIQLTEDEIVAMTSIVEIERILSKRGVLA